MVNNTLIKPPVMTELQTGKGKVNFLILNILLIAGVVAIVFTLLYILFHLDQSDRIILRCVPVILSGLVLVLIYFIGSSGKSVKRDSVNKFNGSARR